jgi:hypothetical protein
MRYYRPCLLNDERGTEAARKWDLADGRCPTDGRDGTWDRHDTHQKKKKPNIEPNVRNPRFSSRRQCGLNLGLKLRPPQSPDLWPTTATVNNFSTVTSHFN